MPNTNAKKDDNYVSVSLGIDSTTGLTRPFEVDSLGRLLLSAVVSSSSTPRSILTITGGHANNFNSTVLGGASATSALAGTYAVGISTGTDSGAGIRLGFFCLNVATAMSFYDYSPEFQVIASMTNSTASAFVSFIGVSQDTSPTIATGVLTSKHFGFVLDTTTLYASIANGSAQTLVDISSGLTLTDPHNFRAVMSGTTNCKFYVDNVLKATITTNLPSGAFASNVPFSCSIQNDSGVTTNRSLFVGSCSFLFNAE